MLINNKLFGQHLNKVKELFQVSHNSENTQADQTALNLVFGSKYKRLDDMYNYMIGAEQYLTYNKDLPQAYLKRLKNTINPVIIHYAGGDKPWGTTSGGLMRDLWWQYNNLSFEDTILHRALTPVRKQTKGEFFTFTPTDNLLNLELLIRHLPKFTFNIAAWVDMSPKLNSFLEYPNVRLFPRVSGSKVQQLVQNSNVYLDINDVKDDGILNEVNKHKKPMFSFTSVSCTDKYNNYHIFADNDIKGMVEALKNMIVI